MNKIGRNDKCFCGSNKKYKLCCLINRKVITNSNKKSRISMLNDTGNKLQFEGGISRTEKEKRELDKKIAKNCGKFQLRDRKETLIENGIYPLTKRFHCCIVCKKIIDVKKKNCKAINHEKDIFICNKESCHNEVMKIIEEDYYE